MRKQYLLLAFLAAAASIALAQTTVVDQYGNTVVVDQNGNPVAQTPNDQAPGTQYKVEYLPQTPVYRIKVTARTTEAVNYRGHRGTTHINFIGTSLFPETSGEARIESHTNGLGIGASFQSLPSPRTFGPEYLTYVLWAITPEGRAQNLGELLVENGTGSIHVTTDLQAFGLIVTAEPYFAVTRPSTVMVLENQVRSDTKGWEQPIDAKFDAVEQGEYTADLNAADLPAVYPSNKPLDLLEAENAVAVARATGAGTYAADTLNKAQQELTIAENYYQNNQSKTDIATAARGAVQASEDARLLTIRRKQAEKQVAQAQQTADAQLQAQQAEQDRIQAEQAREQAEQQRQQAAADAQQARWAAQQANQARIAAQQQTEQMRQRLLQQLNAVLETRSTARGLIVNMPDVLFDPGQSTLKPGARERLARVSGIVQAYPDLQLQVEGYTDSTGTPEFNQRLSEDRAAAVRSYLISQGVPSNDIASAGYGADDPVASNDSAEGRRLNRRVDLVVTGTAIGEVYASPPPSTSWTPAAPPPASSYSSGDASAVPAVAQPMPATPAAVQPNTGVSQPPPQ